LADVQPFRRHYSSAIGFLFLLLMVIGFSGCATPVRRSPGRGGSPISVPFIAQKPNFCGPAALAMLAQYYGHCVTQDDVAGAIYLPEIRGTLTTELADYARRFNLWVRQYRGSETDLRQKLAAGVPLIVLGKFGRQYHYFVVLHVDDFQQTVTVHSDTRAGVEFSQDEFRRFWERADRWTLLVCPLELASNPSRRAAWRLSADEHNDLGVLLERTGHPAAAAGNYREATELQPTNSHFQMNLGNALLKQKLFSEAAAAYAQAMKLDPENADAMNNLACAYAEIGADLDQAIQLCHRAAALRPSHRAYYLDTLGSVLLKQGKPGEAVAAFESALTAVTDHQSALRAGIQQRLAAARAAEGKSNE
jgi:tetratricopeptide (TPR) repeat protein